MNIFREQLLVRGRQYLQTQRFLAVRSQTRAFQTLSARFKSVSLKESSAENNSSEPSKQQIENFLAENNIVVRGYQNEPLENPIFNFGPLDLPDKVMQQIDKQKIDTPTPIQSQSLPILMSEKDLIGIAQTGSGKTLAYLLPAFKKIFPVHHKYFNNQAGRNNPKVLVLAPTRELAQQIFEVIFQFRIYRAVCLYGGSDRNKQIRWLQDNDPLVVIATPGRLNDLLDSNAIKLNDIEYLVLDEADRMLDMGFEPQISKIIKHCPSTDKRQTMMFSATWPQEVQSLVNKYLRKDHAFLSIGGTDLKANTNIKQHVHVCDQREKQKLLIDVLETINQNVADKNQKVIIFVNTQRGCDFVLNNISRSLRQRAVPLHGGLTQRQRENALSALKSGEVSIVVATNVAARGLDIDNVAAVINYDLPPDVETYVHRIGRTGRKNNSGVAYSFFCDPSQKQLAYGLCKVLLDSGNEISDELKMIAQSEGGKPAKSYNRGYDNRQSGNREYGNREYGNREYGNREYGNREYGNRGYGNREYGNRGYGNQNNRGGQREQGDWKYSM